MRDSEPLVRGERRPGGPAAIDDHLRLPATTHQRTTPHPVGWRDPQANAELPTDRNDINGSITLGRELGGTRLKSRDQRRLGFLPMKDRIDFAPPGRSKDSCSRFSAGSTI
jgi:hypothetical protein